ncbi:MAG TPA: haloacid dehalogenase type II [Bosea sp. (in: a-proteobacteria)]|jgi:2-haloacid dehalogenase|uniref:haloacid dehalogenase type II n=1 Tax=Bosea sp. (in: a-proteobacteria) TaxID=1871050 RepID=UPI002E0F627C|nr:haloacid dehalogenase type II [Bosea sp. (in: a-proteobacteria)]
MKLTDFKVLTFDCYGTLIDWETGIWNALQPLISAGGLDLDREEALARFGRIESEIEEAAPSLRYSTLLAAVHARLAKDLGVHIHADLNERFGGSVPDWPAFPDSAEALAYLKRHFRLVILSNVDRASFAASNRKLGVSFDAIYTAEDIGSYKPDPRNFVHLLRHLEADLGLEAGAVLHTAQSLFHDHVPAERAGLARAWIDRRFGMAGSGATQDPATRPHVDFHFKSLAELAEAHRAAMGG